MVGSYNFLYFELSDNMYVYYKLMVGIKEGNIFVDKFYSNFIIYICHVPVFLYHNDVC